MSIRKLSSVDAQEVAALWHEGTSESGTVDPSFMPRPSVREYADGIRVAIECGSVFGWCIASDQDGRLVGYLTAEVAPKSDEWQMESYLHVLDVDVTFSERQQGHAKSLIQVAAAHAAHLGLQRVELSWLAQDPRSSAVWKSLGFQPYLCRGFLQVQPAAGRV